MFRVTLFRDQTQLFAYISPLCMPCCSLRRLLFFLGSVSASLEGLEKHSRIEEAIY